MKRVRIRLTADGREAEIHPVYDLVANAPFVERALALQWNFTGDALGILHYARGDAGKFAAALDGIPEVLGYELERAGEGAFYVYIRDATTDRLREMFRPITRGGLVVIPPIVYHENGTVSLTVFGPDDELQAATGQMPDPVDVTIDAVGGLSTTAAAAESRLTDRQREALTAALDLGYYEVPREADHEAVAAALDLAPSTAAEHLRKAESKLVRAVISPTPE